MREFLESVLGTYTPQSYVDEFGHEIIASGVAGVDWTYVFTGILFVVVIYCVFRILGSFLTKL